MRPVSRPIKSHVKVQPPEHVNIALVNDAPATNAQGNNSDDNVDDSEPEPELPAPANDEEEKITHGQANNPMVRFL